MSQVKWKISLLFALITLSIFFSLLLSSDKFTESMGNEVNTTAMAEFREKSGYKPYEQTGNWQWK